MDELIRYLSERNILQTKALRKSLDSLSLEEKQEFIKIINFYKENYTISELGDAYLLFTEDTLKETKYYVEHGTYRYSTFAEVADYVYYNKEYMTKYMLGLGLSAYLWSSHIKIHRWWQSLIRNIGGGGYLEIGPGHGRYFCEILNLQNFNDYYAVDLSETSVKLTQEYVERFKNKNINNYQIELKDFYEFDINSRFKLIAAAEVMEHLENPRDMLVRMYDFLEEDGCVYLTIPINSPAVDHIYHFKTIDEVRELIESIGFTIIDVCCATANDISLEKAKKKKMSIIMGVFAKKCCNK